MAAETPPFDPARFRPRPLSALDRRVQVERFARLVEPEAPGEAFLDSLPDFLGVRSLRALARAVVAARRQDRPVLWGLGGHVVKVGLGPLLVDLAARGFLQGLALNGAAAIHDAEVALTGRTSEDVDEGLAAGTYGAADETGRLFAEAARRAGGEGTGLGTALARALAERDPAHRDRSLLCRAHALDLPVTVHVALGTDTVHMHPACEGSAVGEASHRDFLRWVALVEGLDGGVYLNVGSAVLLPEVFLKAVAMVRNAWAAEDRSERPLRIVTGNLDMLRHYRTRRNVLERPAETGHDLAGHHEILVPLLRLAVLAEARRREASP